MEELKKPYKITLWEDKPRYIYNQQNEVTNQWLEEVCIATIGSNTMDTPIRAFNPILTEDLNGSKTFTFQIYYRYWDDEDEEFKINPFTNLLVNERKVKLFYNDEWYDFVIKQVQENSETYVFTYTCKDLFVNELGKTGYNVELDTELQNNMGTITQLAATILDGSTWTIDTDNSDLIRQYSKEMLYSVRLSTNISATAMITQTSRTIAAGQVIYIPYSCIVNQENPCQCIYVESTKLKVDYQGFITNGINYTFTPYNNFYMNCAPSTYFGEKLVQKQKSQYFPQIEETCYLYKKNNIDYYCYTETEYTSITEIQALLSNNSDFVTTNGWSIGYNGNQPTASIALSTYQASNNAPVYSTLQFTKHPNYSGNSFSVVNSGFYDNRAQFSPNGLIQGEPYIFAIKGSNNNLLSSARVDITHKDTGNVTSILNFSNISSSTDVGINQLLTAGYKVFGATCQISKDYQDLVTNYTKIDFILTFSNTFDLIDSLAFKKRTDVNGNTIIPDISSLSYSEGGSGSADNAIIKTFYNFFPASTDFTNIYGKEDLTITERKDNTLNYIPQYDENFEKVTSISGSKSNRFNLIQSLCEAFECWAKFSIEHNSKGQTIYEYVQLINESEVVSGGRYYTRKQGTTSTTDDAAFEIVATPDPDNYANYFKKVYHKYVTFKEYIGKDNLAGFHYGINLKSIQRNLVSDQIATKVIVQPNTNEFAPNGSCTIQQASLNPTGENALYNFQYFINHGLIDSGALNDDLYGTNGGLGFFTQMFALNRQMRGPVDELAEIGLTLNTLESRNTVYSTLLLEAQNNKAAITQELAAAGYGNDETQGGGEYIDKLRKQRDSYDSMITHYTQIQSDNATLLHEYRDKYTTKLTLLQSIREQKDQINNEFHNKYSQFIQEGTWNSNDYWDPELYYEAANMVSFTSAFPQISYTINVLEISAIEGFEPYTFQIGDKTYIEDVKFFGYDDKHRPYKEEIVVSQIKVNLDDPSQNTITVRNYKTQFQDLFQRITATSQSLQYHEGEYMRAASAITSDGEVDATILQNSLMNNSLIIANAKNQLVSWDDTGITITNSKNANEIVRLTSGGIVLTADGGQSWTTGITGSGINANVITAGRIDTSKIRIFNEGQQTFEWNGKGIHAFAVENNKVNYGKFVRFDQYGLYGYAGGNPDWDPDVQEQSETIGISKVIRDSIFSLTWEGLSINVPANSQTMDIINVTNNGSSVFKVDSTGKLTATGADITGSITMGAGSTINWNGVTESGSRPYEPAGSVPGYIQSTYIDSITIRSPTIEANQFIVKAPDSGNANGYYLYGYYNHRYYNWLKIWYFESTAPLIHFGSDGGSICHWDFETNYVNGSVEFDDEVIFNGAISGLSISDVSGLRSELDDIWNAINA